MLKIETLTYVNFNGETFWVSEVNADHVTLRCANPRDGLGYVLQRNSLRWAEGADETGTRTLELTPPA